MIAFLEQALFILEQEFQLCLIYLRLLTKSYPLALFYWNLLDFGPLDIFYQQAYFVNR